MVAFRRYIESEDDLKVFHVWSVSLIVWNIEKLTDTSYIRTLNMNLKSFSISVLMWSIISRYFTTSTSL